MFTLTKETLSPVHIIGANITTHIHSGTPAFAVLTSDRMWYARSHSLPRQPMAGLEELTFVKNPRMRNNRLIDLRSYKIARCKRTVPYQPVIPGYVSDHVKLGESRIIPTFYKGGSAAKSR